MSGRPGDKDAVLLAALGAADVADHLNAMGLEPAGAAAMSADGIEHSDDNPANTRGEHERRAGVGASPSDVAAGFETDVECRAARPRPGRCERNGLGVRCTGAAMIALADDSAFFVDDYAADERIGRGLAAGARRELETAPYPRFIAHERALITSLSSRSNSARSRKSR